MERVRSIDWDLSRRDTVSKVQPEYRYPYRGKSWDLLAHEDILDPGRPTHVYLRRLIVFKTPLCALYRHSIYVRDRDRDPHNHPRGFWSWVLRGGYEEKRWRRYGPTFMPSMRVRRRWSLAHTDRRAFHTIEILYSVPTVTLIWLGPRHTEGWGFLTPEGFVASPGYIAEKEAQWREEAGVHA